MTYAEAAAVFLADRKAARRELKVRKGQLAKARQHLKDCLTAQEIVQTVAQQVQESAHRRIAGVVTKCLAAVFPNPYTFHIIFEKKRGRTEAGLEFRRGELRLRPQDGVGGSVLDVAAFALRLACLGLHRPKRRKVVFVDEGFRGLSSRQGNKKRVAKLLETLADELGFQIVLVTHDKGLRVGKIIEL